MNPELQIALFAFNVVLGLAAFFGGMVLRGLMADVKALQAGYLEMIKQLSVFATRAEVKADVSEVRTETREALADLAKKQSEGFSKVFDKLDAIQKQVSEKADRNEVTR